MKDLTGHRFNSLTVLTVGEKRKKHQYWLCQCDCGTIKEIRSDVLKNGQTVSCGCVARQRASDRLTKHGLSRSPLYNIHSNMIERCYCPDSNRFHCYGKRGVTICDEWEDIKNFVLWAQASGYKDGLTLDRIDVNGNYEPNNCRWATPKEQSNNTRRNIFEKHNGEVKTIKQWSEYCGIDYYTFHARIRKLHWPIEKALTAPVRTR